MKEIGSANEFIVLWILTYDFKQHSFTLIFRKICTFSLYLYFFSVDLKERAE